MKNKPLWAAIITGLVISGGVLADNVTIPNTFTPNTPARASEVNANFTAVKTSVDNNYGHITALQSSVTSLQTAEGQNWKRGGNTGTTSSDYLGTADNQPLVLRVNATPAFRIIPTSTNANIVAGGLLCPTSVGANVQGAFIANTNAPAPLTACQGSAAERHRVYDHNSSILGGYGNAAGSNDALPGNSAYATVAGGVFNAASGYASITLGGDSNTASGSTAIAAGNRANATHNFSFIVNLAGSGNFYSSAANQFAVKATSFYFGGPSATSADVASGALISTSTGAYLSSGGTWTNSSDIALKDNLRPVAAKDVLRAVKDLPVYEWNYRAEDERVRHIGPTAQDFAARFSVGADNKHIATVDADGVALAAIQGLAQVVEEQRALLAHQQKELEALRERIDTMQRK